MIRRLLSLSAFALLPLAACDKPPPPIPAAIAPAAVYEGLPLTGNQGTALAAGFRECMEVNRAVRCTKRDVPVLGVGPYTAAIDLAGTGPVPLFDHVTLWHDRDQGAILDIGDTLKRGGWKSCLSGDFEYYGRADTPVRVTIDASYWGKRRAVISLDKGVFKAC
jgi:hypothetical protein